jgi:integrase
LRHFGASALIAAGRDARTVAGRLGHAAALTALRVYAHMVEGHDREAADFLGKLITADRPAPLDG